MAFSDFLRAKLLTGFPWNLWAYSLSGFTEVLQILNLVGLFAFNLLAITIFTFPAILFFNNDGLEIRQSRVVGFIDAENFIKIYENINTSISLK